jgi:hypothetical protein
MSNCDCNQLEIYRDNPATIVEVITQGPIGPPGPLAVPTFEYVSKNLKSLDFEIDYNVDGSIAVITYSNGVTKTFGYVSGNVSTITLAGSELPIGIDTIKTLQYDAGNVVGATYS